MIIADQHLGICTGGDHYQFVPMTTNCMFMLVVTTTNHHFGIYADDDHYQSAPWHGIYTGDDHHQSSKYFFVMTITKLILHSFRCSGQTGETASLVPEAGGGRQDKEMSCF